jgi:alkanesulfonate monooxygenase SsuD/methylene tetrahydromethanopterin reductase-like flavin-dependent oxidoreductase (luciferase family)
MELGVALPTSGQLASPANIVRIAQEAERLGYAAVWTYERLLRPIAFSAEVVPALATIFREAAEAAGRDPAGLTVVVRANIPLTREPLGDGRPFLGGSPRQIAEDVARLEPAGVGHVLFSNRDARDLEAEVGLLGELRAAVGATA